MTIGKLKARADQLSRDALLERRHCTAKLGNALAILRRRVGSHAGLAISFSLGFIAGTRRSSGRPGRGTRRGRGRAREQLVGTLAGSAAKLLVAMLANALAVASEHRGGAAAAPGQQHQASRRSRSPSADAPSAAA